MREFKAVSYKLFWGDVEIGIIKGCEADFPNLSGYIEFETSYLSAQEVDVSRLRKYIQLQAKSCDLIEVEHETDVEKELDLINQELDQYLDFVESDKWHLIDENGNTQSILSPIINSNNEVTWRWKIV